MLTMSRYPSNWAPFSNKIPYSDRAHLFGGWSCTTSSFGVSSQSNTYQAGDHWRIDQHFGSSKLGGASCSSLWLTSWFQIGIDRHDCNINQTVFEFLRPMPRPQPITCVSSMDSNQFEWVWKTSRQALPAARTRPRRAVSKGKTPHVNHQLS